MLLKKKMLLKKGYFQGSRAVPSAEIAPWMSPPLKECWAAQRWLAQGMTPLISSPSGPGED